jgi:hypothetical protein
VTQAPAAAADASAARGRGAAPRRAGGVATVVAAALLYALATPFVLRPWFLGHDLLPHAPGAIGSMIDADLYLNVWILAWIAHAALTDPSRLYDGNIFHPAANAIAGSENMLAHLPVTAPALALSGSALVLLKAYVFECFVLSGVAMFLYVRHHTRSTPAAFVAGAAYTFTFFRASTIPQPQYLGIQFLPIALLCVDLWLERRRVAWLAGLALAIGLQALSCVYVGFFTLIVVPVYALVRLASVRDRRGAATGGLAAALAGGVLALVPAALPYLHARAEGVIPRQDPALIRWFSWAPWEYASRGFLERAGLVPVALVLLDVAMRAVARVRGTVSVRIATTDVERALWCVALTGVVLSAGPSLDVAGIAIPLPYRALYELVPGFSSIRVPIRFAIVVAAALAALSGFVVARWTRALGERQALALGAALALGCVVDAAPRPVPVVAAGLGDAAPAVYAWLARQPGEGSVLEVPGTAGGDDVLGNARSGRYMIASTIHWKPIVNGWTAYPPHVAQLLAAAIRDLPGARALELLREVSGLEWIVVHRDQLLADDVARWPRGELPGLTLVQSFGETDVYRVDARPARDLRADVIARGRAAATTTLQGASTAPLAPACRAARLAITDAPTRVLPIPAARRVGVRITNASTCAWPGLGVRAEGLVTLGYRWTSPSGKSDPPGAPSRLLDDVAAGATVDAAMLVTPPVGEPGPWRLDVVLQQDGLAAPLAVASRTIELRAATAAAETAPRQPGVAGSSS